MIKALTTMLNKSILSYEYQETQLAGGSIGNVRLIYGTAMTNADERIPFKMVYKSHEKFERPGDLNSWKREYDLYDSDLNKSFSKNFRWPICYHAEISDKKFEIWMEYINAPSGFDLNSDMLEKAALEIGRWQGKIFTNPELCQKINQMKNLSDPGFLQRNFSQWHTQTMPYEYIISNDCQLPKHINDYYLENKGQINHNKSIEYNILRTEICNLPQHLKQMLIDVDERQNKIFENFKRLPIVFCQRDYWLENIFYDNGDIIVIDWDTAGWGYLGEDIAQLIFDDVDIENFNIYSKKLILAYYEGYIEFAKTAKEDIENSKAAIRDFILIVYGYRMVQKHIFTQSVEKKALVEKKLQIIYDLKL